jgi:RHS repeat-associated protein
MPTVTPTYDANGNLTNDGLHAYSWDADGNSATVDSMVSIPYDALGRAVEQNRGGTYSQSVYAPGGSKLAIMSGQNLQQAFIPLPGGATAVYNSSGLAYYRHADWLGSSRIASTPDNQAYASQSYAPFGEAYVEAGRTDRSFAGHDEDTVAGIYDAPFRKYDPYQGRWISPDPGGLSVVDPTNPQSWNRYAYVLNNPLKHSDPTGLACVYLTDDGNEIAEVDDDVAMEDCVGDGPEGGGYWVSGPVTDVFVNDDGTYRFGWSGVDENGNLVTGVYANYIGPIGTVPGGGTGFENPAGWSFGYFVLNVPIIVGQNLVNEPTDATVNEGNRDMRLFGTHWCGPGGSGTVTSTTDAACWRHDMCYAANNLEWTDNRNKSLPPAKAAALQQCNQQLCNSVRRGSTAGDVMIDFYFTAVGKFTCR